LFGDIIFTVRQARLSFVGSLRLQNARDPELNTREEVDSLSSLLVFRLTQPFRFLSSVVFLFEIDHAFGDLTANAWSSH
jgi:hypothetical protein